MPKVFTNVPPSPPAGSNFVTDSEKTAIGTIPVKATGAEVTTGTDDAKFVTAKAVADQTVLLKKAGGTMTGDITLGENTAVALDPSLSADGKYTGITITGTAGAALAFGDVIVLDVTAGKWLKADVSAAAAADGDVRGMVGMCVLAAAADADPTKILLQGVIKADTNFPAFTTGVPIYASTTGDVVTAQPTTTDHVIRVLGFTVIDDTSATAPQSIYFNPSPDYTTHA